VGRIIRYNARMCGRYTLRGPAPLASALRDAMSAFEHLLYGSTRTLDSNMAPEAWVHAARDAIY
jgi:hypothetical protein